MKLYAENNRYKRKRPLIEKKIDNLKLYKRKHLKKN